MATYKGMQSILTASLGDYAEQGFSLYQLDDHVLALDHKDDSVCTFSAEGATIPKIRQECQRHLEGKKLECKLK